MLDPKKLKTFNCSACGGDLEIKNPRSKFVSCPYCGTTSELSGEAKSTEKGDPTKFKVKSFLKLGDIGEFNGVSHQIIGRTCWQNDYKEYDSEDRKYYNEKWDFDEWILLSNEGTYKTIIEDKEGYKIAETIIPKYPHLPKESKMKNFNSGQAMRAKEYGRSNIKYFEGESTYLIEIGAYSKFAQYSSGGIGYIAEWRFFENNELKEIEFFKEKRISKRELQIAFGQEPTEKASTPNTSTLKEKKTHSKILLIFGLLNLAIGLYFSITSTNNQTILHRSISLNDQQWAEMDDTTFFALGDLDVKLGIPKNIPGISVYTSSNFPVDSVEITNYLYFFDAKNDTVATTSSYFYTYNSDVSIADKQEELLSFTSEGIEDSLRVSFRFEMPKKTFARLNNSTIDMGLLFQAEGKNQSGAFTIMLGIFFLFAAYSITKKQ